MTALLVTNDFPPKIGGIQSYLYELWRRLPPDDATVFTTSYPGAREWDAAQPFRIVRGDRVLLPTRALARRIDELAAEVRADVIFLDPWLPLGALAPRLTAAPVVVIVHGAEVTVPGHLPGVRELGARGLRAAAGILAAGSYPAREAARAAGRPLAVLRVPPGVDTERFVPLDATARERVRRAFGLDSSRPLVLGSSRLVPRKGFDTLIAAAAGLRPEVQVAIVGSGRDRRRLALLADGRAPGRIRFLGRIADDDLAPLTAAADVFAVPCRDRWRGLEAEGFGIVFVEAAACGVAAVAGRSGGTAEAVVDGVTGFVVAPRPVPVRLALDRLLADGALRRRMGGAGRERVVAELSYDRLVPPLARLAAGDLTVLTT